MPETRAGATIPEVIHHRTTLNDRTLHYVTAGTDGTPILLVHGFPESWWAFHKLIPLIAGEHRVIAVDLPGFGDSGHEPGDYTSSFAAESLRQLVEHLELGPVHLTGQDIGGVSTFRLAASHPELIRSYTAIETGLPGFGLETLADVTHGGAWHIGVLAAPGIPKMLLTGRERDFLALYAYPTMSATEGAISEPDIDEFTRVYSRPNGFGGATGLYRSMLAEGEEIKQIVAQQRLTMPVLAVGAGTGRFTYATMGQVAQNVTEAKLDGIGHLAAIEDPETLAQTLLGFYRTLDA
ncbi:MAG: alpha/beta hydrolase [Solirubrobacteraceae bacterium]|jgi:pimeloyl-ACP methyl ester carboxylesterase